MKGNYTGTQTVLFNIRGKKMPAPKLKAHSRALKVHMEKAKSNNRIPDSVFNKCEI